MTESVRKILLIVCDLAIFFVTLGIIWNGCLTERKWDRDKAKRTFRFFTTLSNVFCALASLAAVFFLIGGEMPLPMRLIRYTSTASVAVTMVTVLVFLGPQFGYGPLLAGGSLFLHLLTPLAAIVSFAFLETGTLTFPQALLGLLPVAAYGALYCYKVIFAPEERKWEDFYGYNNGGHWKVSIGAMLAGTFLLCIVLWALDKI